METEEREVVESTEEVDEQSEQAEVTEPVQEPEASPEPVPYDRFSEVNTRLSRAEQENEQLRNFILSQRQQPQQQQQAYQPVFDQDTDRQVAQIADRVAASRVAPLETENHQLKAKQIDLEMSKDPDWSIYKNEVNQLLVASGLNNVPITSVDHGVQVAKMLLNSVKADKGVFSKQAVQRAETNQRMRASAAGTPGKQAPRKTEKVPFDKLSPEQRREVRSRIKRGLPTDYD